MAKLAHPIGDLDLHLFGEGTHRRLWELLGPQPLHVDAAGEAVGSRVAVWAPDASAVFVRGDWNEWGSDPLASIGVSGLWSALAPLARTGQRYGFAIEDRNGVVIEMADPMAREIEPGGVSVIPSVDRHQWHDDAWMGVREAPPAGGPLRIWHADVEALRNDGVEVWSAVAPHLLDRVAASGCTHVEVEPVDTRSAMWYAPSALGGATDDFRRMVDEFHQHGVGVLVVWRPTGDSGSGDLGRDEPCNELRNVRLASALYWIEEFHADGLRVRTDSASPDNAAFILQTNAVVAEEFPDAVMVVE